MAVRIFYILSFVLSVFVQAHGQDLANRTYNYLQILRSEHEHRLNHYIIDECEQYLEAYPFSSNAPDVLVMLADVRAEKGDGNRAFSLFLKTQFLYPDYTKKAEVDKRLADLVSRQFRRKSEKIQPLIQAIPAAQGMASRQFKYLEMLTVLVAYDLDDLIDALKQESSQFHMKYPDDARRDSVAIWLADIYRRYGKDREAASEYLKFEHIYSESAFLPYARFHRANLLFSELGKPREAIQLFDSIAIKHKETKYAPQAVFQSGIVREKKLKDYQGAIRAYRRVVTDFSDSTQSLKALEETALIQEKRLNAYGEAVKTYEELLSKFDANLQSPEGFIKLAKLYNDKLKDFTSAAKTYSRAAARFPAHDKSPDYLYKAGDIAEDDLQNDELALFYYQKVVELYPNHKKTRAALEHIDKIELKNKPEESQEKEGN